MATKLKDKKKLIALFNRRQATIDEIAKAMDVSWHTAWRWSKGLVSRMSNETLTRLTEVIERKQ